MSWTCKGICEMESYRNTQFKKGYDLGQRFCRTCQKFFDTASFRCTCCNQILRRSRRYSKSEDDKTNMVQAFSEMILRKRSPELKSD